MIPNYKKKKSNYNPRNLWIHIGGVFVILVCVGLIVANVRIWQKKQEFKAQVADLKNQIQQIENSNNSLKEKMGNANDNAYIEKIAREEGDLQMPGETAVSFVMPKTQAPEKNEAGQTFWQNWLNWFKNIF